MIGSKVPLSSYPPMKFILKNGPIPASFCLFSSCSHYNFNITNWKKCRWCARDLNPGPQDGRRRRNHGAMAAVTLPPFIFNTFSIIPSKRPFWSTILSVNKPTEQNKQFRGWLNFLWKEGGLLSFLPTHVVYVVRRLPSFGPCWLVGRLPHALTRTIFV